MSAHASISFEQLLQWTIATGAPSGVATMSISGYGLDSGRSSTAIRNTDVPADMFPVFGDTLFVAAMPVPASPSGGASSAPGSSSPLGSSIIAPPLDSLPASPPADTGSGSMSRIFHGSPLDAWRASNLSSISSSYREPSSGNIPLASPTPTHVLPPSLSWMYPASVVSRSMSATCGSSQSSARSRCATLHRCGTLKPNSSESSAADRSVIVLRHVRNSQSGRPARSSGRYPCIMPLTPSAPSFVIRAPWRSSASAFRAA